MDLLKKFDVPEHNPFKCVDMHTTGEPTRIVYAGWPPMTGTLLEQRVQAKTEHDHHRKCLMLEPRGHFNMYGALLRPDTELTQTGQAHMGVLFMTNDGYSTMCGHATLALGRFLIDTQDKNVFPKRDEVKNDPATGSSSLKLHAPCGLIEVTVPTVKNDICSDPSRPVSFVCVPSSATGLNIQIHIPPDRQWAQLNGGDVISCDFAYGGAFYCMTDARQLGFAQGLSNFDFDAMNYATKQLKAAINENPSYRYLFRHPDHDDLGFLYSIMVVDKRLGKPLGSSNGAETGLCFFADQQVDRSPTGSGVAARLALACAYGKLQRGDSWSYHSLLSNSWEGRGGFVGTLDEIIGKAQDNLPLVNVRVEGHVSYTGFSTFVSESDDEVQHHGGGFIFEKL